MLALSFWEDKALLKDGSILDDEAALADETVGEKVLNFMGDDTGFASGATRI